jgi:hypothetical protein
MPETRPPGLARSALGTWQRLNFEQKVAAVGAALLIVSTFGPFSFVEVAEILVGAGVLALLRARGEGKRFHLPFGDGTVVLAAGCWAALLIVVRLFDRPLGQNLLALGCAGILVVAGAAERAKRPPDDLPGDPDHDPYGASPRPQTPLTSEPTPVPSQPAAPWPEPPAPASEPAGPSAEPSPPSAEPSPPSPDPRPPWSEPGPSSGPAAPPGQGSEPSSDRPTRRLS